MLRYKNRYAFFVLLLTLIISLSSTTNPALAQMPVKAQGIDTIWRGNWDGKPEYWTIMTVRTNTDKVAEVIFAYPRLKTYYSNKISVQDGKSFSFSWGDSKFDFSLQPDGTLKGVRESKKYGRNEISMTAATPKTLGILETTWEGNWGGSSEYWTVVSILPRAGESKIVEVVMTSAKGPPFYSNEVQITDEKAFNFAWGPTATFEFELDGDVLKGVQKLNGKPNAVINLKRMFQ